MKMKIVIAGGFGAGKTTLVGAVSEVTPLSTEETLTEASRGLDSVIWVEGKKSTTVAMDFGRITLAHPGEPSIVVMLFGTPGQKRFRDYWDSLSRGASGAVVLADTRRMEDSFDAITYFEERRVPFVVAINQFTNAPRYLVHEVREALELPEHIPILACDARDRRSVLTVLIELVNYRLTQLPKSPHAALGAR